MPRILLVLSVVFMLGSAVLGFMNKGRLSEAKAAAESEKQRSTTAQAAAEKSKKDLADLNTKMAAETAKATEQEQAVAAKEAELAKVNTDLANLRVELTDKTSALEVAQKDLEAAKLAPVVTTEAPVDPAPALTEMQAKVSSMEAENKVLGDKLAAAESKAIDLNRDIERRKNAVLSKGLEGQILAVNQPWGFVVLSLGDRNGVVSNAEMVVMRDGERIGKVKITSVENSNSIADILSSSVSDGQRVMAGDRVIYAGN